MATAVSNAIGRADIFTPQVNRSGGQQLSNIAVSPISPDTSNSTNDAELANNIDKIDASLQAYNVSNEQYKNDKGLREATSMINGMSPDDIKKLNVIDAAQQEGYVDSTSNPYFKAYADKLRGQFLASEAKQEYDQKFSLTPTATADDERARFANFMEDWRANNLSGSSAPVVSYAFDNGFNEANLINSKQLVDTWNKKDYEQQATTVMASTLSKLGGLTANSVELLKTPNAMTQVAQSILNEPRLMGLPMSTRVSIIDQWSQQMVQTGHLDPTRLEQMMSNLTVGTNLDGSAIHASDVVNLQTLKTEAAEYSKQFITQAKYNFMQTYIDKKDIAGAISTVDQLRTNDPDNAPAYAAMLPSIISGVRAKEAEEARQRAAAAKLASKTTLANVQLRTALKAYINGSTVSLGTIAAAVNGVPEDVKSGVFLESINYAMDTNNQPDMSMSTRMNYISKIMDFPPFTEYRKALASQYSSDIRNIVLNEDGSPVASDTARLLIAMRQSSPQNFSATFGDELDGQVSTITGLIDNHGGDVDAGLQDYARYNSLDDDTKKSYKSNIKSLLANSGYQVDGMHSLGGGETASLPYNASPELTNRIEEQAVVFMAGGASAYDAVNMAGSQITNGYDYYHGAAIPKGLKNNIGTSDDEYYLMKALDNHVYNIADAGGVPAETVDVKYDNRSQMFAISGGGQQEVVSLKQMRDGAYDIYADDVNGASSSGSNDTSMTSDELAAKRNQEGTSFSDMWKAATGSEVGKTISDYWHDLTS